MTEVRITATIVEAGQEVSSLEPLIDYWEVRLDLIGPEWPAVVSKLHKPWIACNRRPEEGGRGRQDENSRLNQLIEALDYGPAMADIELNTPGLMEIVPVIKARTSCLISYHDFEKTPDYSELNGLLRREQQAGADICKIVTTAESVSDNLALLKLIKANRTVRLVAFAMGVEGRLSRVLSPLAGAYFTFASLQSGKESASGQIAVAELRELYNQLKPE